MMPASHIGTCTYLAAPNLIQVPANALEKTAESGPNAQVSATCAKDTAEAPVPGFSHSHYSLLRSDSAHGKALFFL